MGPQATRHLVEVLELFPTISYNGPQWAKIIMGRYLKIYNHTAPELQDQHPIVWLPISVGGLDFEYARSPCQLNGNKFLCWGGPKIN